MDITQEQTMDVAAPNVAIWRLIGALTMLASIALVIMAANMRPTVATSSTFGNLYGTGSTEVFNAGLMQQQMMIFVGGLAGLIFALIAFATAALIEVIWRGNHR